MPVTYQGISDICHFLLTKSYPHHVIKVMDQHSVLWSGEIRLAHTDLWTKVALCLQGLVLTSGLSYPKGRDFSLFPQDIHPG